MQGPMLYRAARGLFQEARIKYGERRGKDVSHIKGGVPDGDEDPVLPHHQVGSRASSCDASGTDPDDYCRCRCSTGSSVSAFRLPLRWFSPRPSSTSTPGASPPFLALSQF